MHKINNRPDAHGHNTKDDQVMSIIDILGVLELNTTTRLSPEACKNTRRKQGEKRSIREWVPTVNCVQLELQSSHGGQVGSSRVNCGARRQGKQK